MTPTANYQIRPYGKDDLPVLAGIYRDAIRHRGPECYSEQQVAAWSSFPDALRDFEYWLTSATTWVAVDRHDNCIGFTALEEPGRISALFVAPAWMGQGVGYGLLNHLLKEARLASCQTVTTEASEFSRPLFEKFGFVVLEIEHTEFKGVAFTRYAMQTEFQRGSGDAC